MLATYMQPVLPSTMVRGPAAFTMHLHDQRRLAALAGAVSRGEELLERELLHALEGVQRLRGPKFVSSASSLSLTAMVIPPRSRSYSRNPIHFVPGCVFPSAAR